MTVVQNHEADRIDCVVVGFADDPAPEYQVPMPCYGPAWPPLLDRTISFRGRRYDVNGVLSAAIAEATGEPFAFHVARTPSLPVLQLASFLRQRSLLVDYVNFVDARADRLLELLRRKPRSVALTTTYYGTCEKPANLVRLVKTWSPETKTIVGGPYIHRLWSTESSRPCLDRTLFQIGADVYIVDSQGESTLSLVCAALRDSVPLQGIANVIFRDGGIYRRSVRPPSAAIGNRDGGEGRAGPPEGIYGTTGGCDDLWRVIEHNSLEDHPIDWRVFLGDFPTPMVQTRTARSCAFRCAFCSYPSAAGPLEFRSLRSIENELERLHELGVRYIVFNDDTFNVPVARFKDICRLLAKPKYGIQWFSFFRAGNSDDEMFALMEQSGCTGVLLGIESGAQEILNNMNKGARVDQYLYAMRELRRRQMTTFASFIIGFPGETEATLKATADFIDEARPDYFELEPFFCDPAAPVARQAGKFGLTGSGLSWTHATMTSGQAVGCQRRLRSQLMAAGHKWCDVTGFSIWGYAYMLSLGFSRDETDRILALLSRMNLEGQGCLCPAYSRSYEDEVVRIIREASPSLDLGKAAACLS